MMLVCPCQPASQRCSACAHDPFMFHLNAAVCMNCIGGLSTCRRKMLQPAVARIAALSLWRPWAAPAQARAIARALGSTPQADEVEPPVGNSGVTPRRTSPGARVLGGRRSQPTLQVRALAQAAAVWRQERRHMEAALVAAKVVNAHRAKRVLLGNVKRARRCPPRRQKPRQRAANAPSTVKLDCPATRRNIDSEGEFPTGHRRWQLVSFVICHVAINSVSCLLCHMVLANGMSRQHGCSHVLSTCARAGMCLILFGG